ncbi:MAG: tetratricopeptide repeat protein [Candidatus Gastranaerophilaceae bacterium]
MAKQHKLDPAQKELDVLLKKYPNNPTLHYAQGLVYMQRQTSSDVDYIKNTRGLLNSAIKEFVAAVNLNNKYYEAYNAMGVATLKLGNRNDALDLFNTAVKINPTFATAYDNIGVVEMMNGNLDSAERYFNSAMKQNSHNPTAWYHMAQVETRRGNYSKALTWVNHSVHVNPNSSPALTLQGELYLKQGNQAAAINSFKKAQLVKPENSRPYLNLATIYENRADEEFAMEQLKTALAINPNYQEGKLKIANMALHTRKYEQALDYYSKLVGDKNYNEDAIIGLANTYYEMSKDRGENNGITTNKEVYLAYDYINKAIEQCPEDLELHLAKLKLARLVHQEPLSRDSLNYIVQAAATTLWTA